MSDKLMSTFEMLPVPEHAVYVAVGRCDNLDKIDN